MTKPWSKTGLGPLLWHATSVSMHSHIILGPALGPRYLYWSNVTESQSTETIEPF